MKIPRDAKKIKYAPNSGALFLAIFCKKKRTPKVTKRLAVAQADAKYFCYSGLKFKPRKEYTIAAKIITKNLLT